MSGRDEIRKIIVLVIKVCEAYLSEPIIGDLRGVMDIYGEIYTMRVMENTLKGVHFRKGCQKRTDGWHGSGLFLFNH